MWRVVRRTVRRCLNLSLLMSPASASLSMDIMFEMFASSLELEGIATVAIGRISNVFLDGVRSQNRPSSFEWTGRERESERKDEKESLVVGFGVTSKNLNFFSRW